jgi:RHH-type rel operon transcriptional repressor/antitoxin RelB
MLAVRLDPDLEARLDAVARRTGRSKSFYAREALREKIEELEDIALLEEALRDPDAGKTISLEELKAELGLDD